MTSTTGLEPTRSSTPVTTSGTSGTTHDRPGRLRRTALVATGFLACALPTVFTVNVTRMLLTGQYADHRFHQATGQGLILFALWLVPLVGLLRAGWAGHRPSPALGWQHLAFVATGVLTAAIAPGGGAPWLVGVIALTGALTWVALPKRPRLRAEVQIDPVLAPVALIGCAVLTPYVIDQLAAQNAVTGGYHAENPHLFDMAWMSACLIALGIVGATLPAARHLVGWLGGGAFALGAAGLLFGQDAGWSSLVLAVGILAGLGCVLGRRTRSTRTNR